MCTVLTSNLLFYLANSINCPADPRTPHFQHLHGLLEHFSLCPLSDILLNPFCNLLVFSITHEFSVRFWPGTSAQDEGPRADLG